MIDRFVELLENEVKNYSIYVWGGNGESYPTVNEDWIERHETNASNAKRAINTYRKAVAAAYQKANNLTVDGKAGKNTITKLGFKWVG